MAKLIKDFRKARAAIDLVFKPDMRLILDTDSVVTDFELKTPLSHLWLKTYGSPVGKPYEVAHRLMGGMTVESVCF